MNLSYVLDKIRQAPLTESPFLHLAVTDLFAKADFDAIVNSPEIALRPVADDTALFDELFARQYRIVPFPGCTTDHREYIDWHRTRKVSHKTNTTCEGFGVVLRLVAPSSPAIIALQTLLTSSDFITCIAEKFRINPDDCTYDSGIQKYLDGYEISPHPDVRAKALTFMVNLNPDPDSAEREHHTSYLQFKSQWRYVQEFWQGNPTADRCWVPWEWCEVKTQQRMNNSLVLFSPNCSTLHAVKARYDHLGFQRTQLYGNLWYKNFQKMVTPKWEDLVIATSEPSAATRLRRRIRNIVQRMLGNEAKDTGTHTTRRH